MLYISLLLNQERFAQQLRERQSIFTRIPNTYPDYILLAVIVLQLLEPLKHIQGMGTASPISHTQPPSGHARSYTVTS